MHLAQTALFGVIGVLALLLVLRPMVLRLTTLNVAGTLSSSGTALAVIGGGAPGGASAVPELGALSVVGPAPRLLEDESMVNIAQIEGQMRASSLRRITQIVEKHPDETLSIVRGWMVQESN
jgi:flagellar M-ring protein FliF